MGDKLATRCSPGSENRWKETAGEVAKQEPGCQQCCGAYGSETGACQHKGFWHAPVCQKLPVTAQALCWPDEDHLIVLSI